MNGLLMRGRVQYESVYRALVAGQHNRHSYPAEPRGIRIAFVA